MDEDPNENGCDESHSCTSIEEQNWEEIIPTKVAEKTHHLPDNSKEVPSESSSSFSAKENIPNTLNSIEVVEETHHLPDNLVPVPTIQSESNPSFSAKENSSHLLTSSEDSTDTESCASNEEQNLEHLILEQAPFNLSDFGYQYDSSSESWENKTVVEETHHLPDNTEPDHTVQAQSGHSLSAKENSPNMLNSVKDLEIMTSCSKTSNEAVRKNKKGLNVPTSLEGDLYLSPSTSQSSLDLDTISSESGFGLFDRNKNKKISNCSRITSSLPAKKRKSDTSKSPQNILNESIQNTSSGLLTNIDSQKERNEEDQDKQISGRQITPPSSFSTAPLKISSPSDLKEVKVVLDNSVVVNYLSLLSKQLFLENVFLKKTEYNNNVNSSKSLKPKQKVFSGKSCQVQMERKDKISLEHINQDEAKKRSQCSEKQCSVVTCLNRTESKCVNSSKNNSYKKDVTSRECFPRDNSPDKCCPSPTKSIGEVTSEDHNTKGNSALVRLATPIKVTDKVVSKDLNLNGSRTPLVLLEKLPSVGNSSQNTSPQKSSNTSNCDSNDLVMPKCQKTLAQNQPVTQTVEPTVRTKPKLNKALLLRKRIIKPHKNTNTPTKSNTQINGLIKLDNIDECGTRTIQCLSKNKIVITRKVIATPLNSVNPPVTITNNLPSKESQPGEQMTQYNIVNGTPRSASSQKDQSASKLINNNNLPRKKIQLGEQMTQDNIVNSTPWSASSQKYQSAPKPIKLNMQNNKVNLTNASASIQIGPVKNREISLKRNIPNSSSQIRTNPIQSNITSRSSLEIHKQSIKKIDSFPTHGKSQTQGEFLKPISVLNRFKSTNVDYSKKKNPCQDSMEIADDTVSVLSLLVTPELESELDCLAHSNTQPKTYFGAVSQGQKVNKNISFDRRENDSLEFEDSYEEQCRKEYGGRTSHETTEIENMPSTSMMRGNEYQENNDIISWINSSPAPTLSDFPEDPLSVKTSLSGTQFQGYCIEYLRTSVSKSEHHQCGADHQVPLILHQTERFGDGEEIAKAIDLVISKNFKNPPYQVLKAFVFFCACKEKRATIIKIGRILKENTSLLRNNAESSKSLWKCFIDAYLEKSRKYNYKDRRYVVTQINETLRSVFTTNGHLEMEYTKLLDIILNILADATSTNKDLQILNCVEFLHDTQYLLEYSPAHFKLAVAKQVVNMHIKAFAYKTYKLLFSGDNAVCNEIFKIDSNTLTQFIETLNRFGIDHSLKNINFNTTNSTNSESGSGEGSSFSGNKKTIGFLNDPFFINKPRQEVNMEHIIIKNKANPSAIVKALGSFTFNEKNLKLLYRTFKNLQDGERVYIKVIQDSAGHIKEALNDITLSFMVTEARKKSWQSSYALYKEVINVYSRNIENYIGRISPAKVMLLCIDVCIKVGSLQEAVNLFINCRMYNTDSTKWTVNHVPDDIKNWIQLCLDIANVFQSTSFSIDLLIPLFFQIINAQKCLEKSVDLKIAFKKFISRLFNENEQAVAAELVSCVIDLNLSKQLLFESHYHYRLLVINMVDGGFEAQANILLHKGKYRVPDYPRNASERSSTLTLKTNLSRQEVFVIFSVKLEAIDKNLEILQNLTITFEEVKVLLEKEIIPQFRDLNCSLSAAIERFKSVLKALLPNVGCYPIAPNVLKLDKLTLQNYNLYQDV